MAMMDDESWRLEMRKTIEGCIARLDEMMAQWRKDDVRGVKQEPENMSDNDSETLKNDQNFVLEENEDIADEVEFEEEAEVEAEFEEKAEIEAEFEKESKATAKIKFGAQDSMGTETKAALSKIQVPIEESTKLEEDGKLQALSYKNSNAANLTHKHDVTLQTLKVIDICEKFERAYEGVCR